jgi:hypothetical protein
MRQFVLLAGCLLAFSLQAISACSAQSTSASETGTNEPDSSIYQVKVAIDPRSTMATSQFLKGFEESCPNVSVVRLESEARYVLEGFGPRNTEWLKHYRITVFDKSGKAIFATDKTSPGSATKEVCRFLNSQL